MDNQRNYQNTIPHLTSRKNIGIYGGSFNPVHLGHSWAILYALSRYSLDEVWVIPCGSHPGGKELLSFWNRFKMCEIAFEHLRKVKVIPIEHYLPEPNYTRQTLEAIRDEQELANLHLIVGQDCMNSIATWEGSEEVMKLAKLLEVPRSGYDKDGHLLPDISSTEIRKRLKASKDVARQMDAGVENYIEEHELYK